MESVKSTLNNITNMGKNNSMISNISNKVPELPSNPLEKSSTEKLMDKFSLSSKSSIPSLQSVTQESSSSFGWGFRIFLLLFILVLLLVNAWTYLEKGKDVFSDNLRNGFLDGSKGFFNSIQSSFDNLVDGTQFSGGVLSDSVKSMINLVRATLTTKLGKDEKATMKQNNKTKKKLDKEINSKKETKEKPEEDKSESEIQTAKKGNFCYIGHQSPHNACVQVNDVRKCMSGKIFKSMKECQGYKPIEPKD